MLKNQYSEPLTDNSEAEPQKGSKKSSCMGFIIDTVETILLALILFLGINAVSARVRVENVSMEPTLMPNEFLLVNRVAYKIGTPKIGDIIIFHAPGADDLDYIKRLIGRRATPFTLRAALSMSTIRPFMRAIFWKHRVTPAPGRCPKDNSLSSVTTGTIQAIPIYGASSMRTLSLEKLY